VLLTVRESSKSISNDKFPLISVILDDFLLKYKLAFNGRFFGWSSHWLTADAKILYSPYNIPIYYHLTFIKKIFNNKKYIFFLIIKAFIFLPKVN